MIAVPYRGGVRGMGVGAGPEKILAALALSATVLDAGPGDDVNALLASAVLAHLGVPIVLEGSCGSAVGVLAGISSRCPGPGVVWFDAHGDFNTPETSPSGSIDGMALAIAVGHCRQDLRFSCGLVQPVPEEHVVLYAPRDLDPLEKPRLDASRIDVVDRAGLPGALDRLAKRVTGVYLHIDVDVVGPFPPGGIEVDDLFEHVRMVAERLPMAAIGIANYDPERDAGGRTLNAIGKLLAILSCYAN